MSKIMSSDSVLRPTRPPVVFETLNDELCIVKLIEQYQNVMPQLVMVRRGYCGETDSDTIGMGQVLRIHGVYSERRVLAKVTTDLNHFFGCGDVMISVPTNCPIEMCCIKKDGSLKPAKPLKTILEECDLPVTVQLIGATRNDVQFKGTTVRLARDVRLTLLKEYDEKYIIGNPVSKGELFQNDLSFPSCVSAITLSVITGIQSPNEEQWQPMLESMNHTVKEYIKFDGKICTSEILDCSSPDFNIKRLKDGRRKKPRRRHSLYIFFSKMKRKNRMSSTLDEHIIDTEDRKAKSQSSCLDSLQPGKRNSTIPVSQSHSFSFFKRPNMRKKNPDHVDSTIIESASSKNTDAVPSTKKTERQGGMVGDAKPSDQISCLDSLQPGNRNSTIPVSQSHSFSFFKRPNMRKKNPDYVDSTIIESASSKNTDAVPSTKKTERQGGMVGDAKPSGQINFRDSLQPGNRKRTIPVSFSYFKRPFMSKKNPDHVDSTVIESASSNNTDAVPSTKNTERGGDMVGGAKPSGQISCLDSLQPGNRNSTIPVSQSHSVSYFKMPIMSKKNPDHVDSTVIESASSTNTDAVPSTKKTERQGGMVGGVQPSGHQVKLQDVVHPPDIKIVKPVNSSSDIDSLLIRDLGQYLHILNIGQYAEQLADAQIDGTLLKELDEEILTGEFGFKRFEAIKLMKFARHGYLPKPSE